jgi:hypothetical protein
MRMHCRLHLDCSWSVARHRRCVRQQVYMAPYHHAVHHAAMNKYICMYCTCLNQSHWLAYQWVMQKWPHMPCMLLPLVARFCRIALNCIHCSSSAHSMKIWQPLHEVTYGTLLGDLMEGGALLKSRGVAIGVHMLLPTGRIGASKVRARV